MNQLLRVTIIDDPEEDRELLLLALLGEGYEETDLADVVALMRKGARCYVQKRQPPPAANGHSRLNETAEPHADQHALHALRMAENRCRRLEAFNHSASDELRVSLRQVEDFVHMLEKDYIDQKNTPAFGVIQRILSTAKQMNDLIDALQGLATPSLVSFNPETVDNSAVLRSMTSARHPLPPKAPELSSTSASTE